jgi:hypothetical protein
MMFEDDMKRKKQQLSEKRAMGRFIYQNPAHRCFKESRHASIARGPFGGFKPVKIPILKPFPMR